MVAHRTKNFKVGDKVSIVIRPENIKISGRIKEENCFRSEIKELIYDGNSVAISVTITEIKNGKIWKVITPISPDYDRIFSDEWDARMYAKEIDKLHK